MRLKKIKNASEIIEKSEYFIRNPFNYKEKWSMVFGNNNPIELEIGMGKGDFLISKSLDNPNINYIGLEKYDSVLVSAAKKLEKLELNNIRIINADAINLNNIFGKEISKIYLNFSDPWPKKRHEKRRLTYEKFLNIYENIFSSNALIEMKTDNEELFSYSLFSFKTNGYQIKEINRNIFDKYQTEYEKKFIKNGKNINYVSIYKTLKK